MFQLAILVLVLSSVPALVSSVYCYSCKETIIVNYTVTSDTVPSFSDCQLVDAARCWISVTWLLSINRTSITVDGIRTPSAEDALEDILTVDVLMGIESDKETPFLLHDIFFSCTTSDKCNDEMGLKRVLHSLVIDDTLRQEIYPLLKVVSPFDPKSAACLDFDNFTNHCPPNDLDSCQRCQISLDKALPSSQKICATCPQQSATFINAVAHSTTFSLKNRTEPFDQAQLYCQLPGCNSIDNINRVYKASNITFDFSEFFKNSSN